MLEFSVKDFKAATITMFSEIKKKILTNKNIRHFIRKIKV